MKQKYTEQELRELEAQLSCPRGENGIEVGHKMNESNIGMTKNTIQFLELENNDCVLELGHGNCGHLELILRESQGIKYFGIEISEAMWEEAQKMDTKGQAKFKLYDGQIIPYPDNYFDRVFTVNTIYFWANPEILITEIERVLKADGTIVLTFADKSFMKHLPFVGEKFRLFEKEDLLSLTENTNLRIIDSRSESDEIESKTGDRVLRKYTMAKIRKQ
ncbi:MAG: class I SAM-dependent methyltransferase [Crocinitomicaceae bacterium]|nr:class I SAM-dependent methyltransferase [Crocinitomicaceae bacterium]